MNRKQLAARLGFGLIFIGVGALGGSYIAKGVVGILGQKNSNSTNGNNPLLPGTPSSGGSHSATPTVSYRGNVAINAYTQPMTWGRTVSYTNKPDEYPAAIQYRSLVKILNLTSEKERGVILNFSNTKDPTMVFDRYTMNSILEHIWVKGYVFFANAQSDSTGSNGGAPVYFPLGEKYSLYKLVNNTNYITLSARNSSGIPVPPTYVSLELTYSTESWYFNNNEYSFNLINVPSNSINYKFDLNVMPANSHIVVK